MAQDDLSNPVGGPTGATTALPVEGLLAERAWLQGLARRMVADAHLADDLVQDAWIAALRAPMRVFERRSQLRAYLAGCLRNRLREHHRRESRRAVRERKGARREALPSTAEVVAEASLQVELAEHLMALDEPLREAVLWRYHRGLSVSRAARHLGIPRSTLQGRLDRALAELRRRMDRSHGSRDAWCAAFAPWIGLPTGGGSSVATLPGLLQAGVAATAVTALGVFGWRGLGDEAPSDSLLAARGALVQDEAALTAQGHGLAADRGDGMRRALATEAPARGELSIYLEAPDPSDWEVTLVDAAQRRFEQRLRSEGPFVFTDLVPGAARLELRARARRARTVELEVLPGVQSEHVVLEPARQVAVRLVDPAGQAWNGARLQRELGSGLTWVVLTDRPEWSAAASGWLARSQRSASKSSMARNDSAGGELCRLELDADEVLYAHLLLADAWVASRAVGPQDTELEFVLSSEHVRDNLRAGLVLRAVDAEGNACPEPTLTLVGGRSVRRFQGDVDGNLSIETAPGRYQARLSSCGHEVALGEVHLEPGETLVAGHVSWVESGGLEVRLRAPRRARQDTRIELRHVDPGAPASVLRTGPRQAFQAEPGGVTRIDAGTGTFAVRAVCSELGWRSAWSEVDLSEGGSREVELELEPTARFEVEARGFGGRAVAAKVWREREAELATIRAFDDSATAAFLLPVGTYRVQLLDAAGESLGEQPARLTAEAAELEFVMRD